MAEKTVKAEEPIASRLRSEYQRGVQDGRKEGKERIHDMHARENDRRWRRVRAMAGVIGDLAEWIENDIEDDG